MCSPGYELRIDKSYSISIDLDYIWHFWRFPKDKDVRKKWEVALRREGFTASDCSIVCSQHFKQADFDTTGQIVRLRDGVIPSLFSFPVDLQKVGVSS